MRWRAGATIPVMITTCLIAACSPPDVNVSVRTIPTSLADDLVRIELSIVDASCGALTLAEAPPDPVQSMVLRRGETSMPLGAVPFGEYALHARGWDAGCTLVAAGCTDVVVDGRDLEGGLSPLSGGGCMPGEACQDGECVTGGDAGMDAGRDTDPADTGVDDTGAGDTGAGDTGAGDTAPADAGPPVLACPTTASDPDPILLYEFDTGDSFATVRDQAPRTPDIDLNGVSVGGAGVTFNGTRAEFVGGHLIASVADSNALHSALTSSQAFTIEVWGTVRDLVNEESAPPERMVTLSEDTTARGFTFGPNGPHIRWRIRTSLTDMNGFGCTAGGTGQLETLDVLSVGEPVRHLVMTFDPADGGRAYIDGAEQTWTNCPGTPALNWVPDVNRFILGDETTAATEPRTFDGSLYRVVIYDRALSPSEVSCLAARGSETSIYD